MALLAQRRDYCGNTTHHCDQLLLKGEPENSKMDRPGLVVIRLLECMGLGSALIILSPMENEAKASDSQGVSNDH